MKIYLFAILLLSINTGIKAQLYVQSNAILHVGGEITLYNQDFIRGSGGGSNIEFEPTSNVLFSGNADNIVSGYINFLNLELAKEGTHKVSLQNYNEEVRGQMVFTSGMFDLNNNSLMLGSSGTLVNENENSRIIGPSGGLVKTQLNLNQPNQVNPGNIGATITSTKNLGDVVIDRGYVFAAGLPLNSVQRHYSINFADPGLDNNLNATLKLNYFDAELTGAHEPILVHWKYDDVTSSWVQQGFAQNTTRNTTDNWVQLSDINKLSTWVLAESAVLLPVSFAAFEVICNNNKPVLKWQTTTEINTDRFEIQRSDNGTNWISIGTLHAAGQSNTVRNYSYTDTSKHSVVKMFYRIQSVDFDGYKKYSAIKVSACGSNKDWQVWPNPVQELLTIRLKLDKASKIYIQLYDNKGSLVHNWQKNLLNGTNLFSIEMKGLPTGIYQLVVSQDEGRRRESINILKQ